MNADGIARLRAATKKGRIKITSRITIRNRIKSRSRSRNYSVAKKLAKKASFCRCVLRMEQETRAHQGGKMSARCRWLILWTGFGDRYKKESEAIEWAAVV